MATVSARRVAFDVLDRVLGQQQPFDDTFAGHPALGTLSLRDRAFARLLLTTTLRRLGQIDARAGALRREPAALGDDRQSAAARCGAAAVPATRRRMRPSARPWRCVPTATAR